MPVAVFTQTLTSGLPSLDCVTASFPEGDIDAAAFWSAGAGAFWASNGKHNKRTSRERAKIFMTRKEYTGLLHSVAR